MGGGGGLWGALRVDRGAREESPKLQKRLTDERVYCTFLYARVYWLLSYAQAPRDNPMLMLRLCTPAPQCHKVLPLPALMILAPWDRHLRRMAGIDHRRRAAPNPLGVHRGVSRE